MVNINLCHQTKSEKGRVNSRGKKTLQHRNTQIQQWPNITYQKFNTKKNKNHVSEKLMYAM
jgi:hypothetical protein